MKLMNLNKIHHALSEASKLSNHLEFIIAGSLTILGDTDIPPAEMVISNDIDCYIEPDPDRIFDLMMALGKDSAFSKKHGYYLDAFRAFMPIFPKGWRERVNEIKFEDGVIARFIEPHDAAVSKYTRGKKNDYRWIESGLINGFLDLNKIKFLGENTIFDFNEDKDRFWFGVNMHLAALHDKKLDEEVLNYFKQFLSMEDDIVDVDNAEDLVINISVVPKTVIAEIEDDVYFGRIVFLNNRVAIQKQPNKRLVVHYLKNISNNLIKDKNYNIRYVDGKAFAKPLDKEKSRDYSRSLELGR